MLGRGLKPLLTTFVCAIFLTGWYSGDHPPHPSSIVVRPAAILSGLFWLAGAILPVWRQSEVNAPSVLNSVAAALAVYAGLAALHP